MPLWVRVFPHEVDRYVLPLFPFFRSGDLFVIQLTIVGMLWSLGIGAVACQYGLSIHVPLSSRMGTAGAMVGDLKE